MAEYLSPGVYVEEYDHSPRAMEGVGTSTAGFVGLAEKGAAKGAPALVTSAAEFARKYGGYLSEFTYGEYRYLAVWNNFLPTAEPDAILPGSFRGMQPVQRGYWVISGLRPEMKEAGATGLRWRSPA